MGFVTRIKDDLGLPITSLTVAITDTATGTPAAGIRLAATAPDGHTLNGRTDEFGKARVDDGLIPGQHRIVLDVGGWFAAHGRASGYQELAIDLTVATGGSHSVLVSISGYAYSVTLEPNAYVPSG